MRDFEMGMRKTRALEAAAAIYLEAKIRMETECLVDQARTTGIDGPSVSSRRPTEQEAIDAAGAIYAEAKLRLEAERLIAEAQRDLC